MSCAQMRYFSFSTCISENCSGIAGKFEGLNSISPRSYEACGKNWNHFRGAGVAAWAGGGVGVAVDAVRGFGSGGVVLGGLPWTWTGVPTSAISKKRAALSGGRRMQPWEAG